MNTSFDPAANILFEARPRKFPWINIVLFVLTCLTTLLIGTLLMEEYNRAVSGIAYADSFEQIRSQPSILLSGLPFMITIMTILFAHEMGHYLTCRYYGVDASLPYFIPIPLAFGTMGAVIRMRSPIPNRAALLEIGIAGPIAGFVVAVIAVIFSIGKAIPFAPPPNTLELGEPLILQLIASFMAPALPAGTELFLHPVSTAAWFGLFVTALNLLPAAQLDGGHVTYALFQQDFHRWISNGVVVVMFLLGTFYWEGWLVWFVLLLAMRLLLLKTWHPPTLNDWRPLERRHTVLGGIALMMFILCFVPMPFSL